MGFSSPLTMLIFYQQRSLWSLPPGKVEAPPAKIFHDRDTLSLATHISYIGTLPAHLNDRHILDESSLRSYFRKILGVQPGASRSALRSARDKRAQRWRTLISPANATGAYSDANPAAGEVDVAASLIEPNSPEQQLAEQRLAMTNTAYDCLSNAEKFREFQIRLGAGEAELPDLDETLSALGENHVKPIAPRVLAKRQALMQEKMERVPGSGYRECCRRWP